MVRRKVHISCKCFISGCGCLYKKDLEKILNCQIFRSKFLWTSSLFVVFCKSYKFYYDEPEYERLKNILGVSEAHWRHRNLLS